MRLHLLMVTWFNSLLYTRRVLTWIGNSVWIFVVLEAFFLSSCLVFSNFYFSMATKSADQMSACLSITLLSPQKKTLAHKLSSSPTLIITMAALLSSFRATKILGIKDNRKQVADPPFSILPLEKETFSQSTRGHSSRTKQEIDTQARPLMTTHFQRHRNTQACLPSCGHQMIMCEFKLLVLGAKETTPALKKKLKWCHDSLLLT